MTRLKRLRTLLLSTMLGLTVVLTACASTGPPVDVLRDRGDSHFKRGAYAKAVVEYQEIAYRYPGDWEAQYRLGVCRNKLGEFAAAKQALEIALTRRPDNAEIADALAEALHERGTRAELFAFLKMRAESTGSVNDYLRLAHYSLELSDPDSARWAIDRAIELDAGNNVEPYLAAADLADRVGDLERKRYRLRQAYGIDPSDHRVAGALRDLGEVPGPSIGLPPGQ